MVVLYPQTTKFILQDNRDITCFESTWESSNDDVAPVDCFQMEDFWFGGAEMYYQDWPINR